MSRLAIIQISLSRKLRQRHLPMGSHRILPRVNQIQHHLQEHLVTRRIKVQQLVICQKRVVRAAGNMSKAGGAAAGNMSKAGGAAAGNMSKAGGGGAGNMSKAGGAAAGNMSKAGGAGSW